MIKILVSTLLLLLIPLLIKAQFIKEIQYPGGDIFGVNGCMVDDHSYIIRGETSDHHTVISKFNLNGDTIWTRIIDGGVVENTHYQMANHQLEVTYDKGCIFTHLGNFDTANFNITKIDSSGNLQWTYLVPSSGNARIVNKIMETSDSGIVLLYKTTASHSGWESFIIKIDKNGSFLFGKTFGANTNSDLDIFENEDHTFYLVGEKIIGKLNNLLQPIKWMKFNGDLEFDRVLNVKNDTIFLRSSDTFTRSSIIKIDTGGNFINQIIFPDFDQVGEIDFSMHVRGNHKVFVAGINSNNVVTIANLDSQFEPISINSFYSVFNWHGEYLMPVNIFESDSQLFVILNIYNNTTGYYSIRVFISDSTNNFCISSPGNFSHVNSFLSLESHVTRLAYNYGGQYPVDTIFPFTSGLTINTICSTTDIVDLNNTDKIILYPNPVFSQFHISGLQNKEILEIYNVIGKKILKKTLSGSGEVVDMSDFPTGIYCIIIGGRFLQKIIKI